MEATKYSAEELATMRAAPVRTLHCACCSSETRGRQWWNRDTGFGLCSACAVWIGSRWPADLAPNYGVEGIHYNPTETK